MYDYRGLRPLRYWSQKVLPLVYDDSLSYYEVLSKVTKKLNEVIEYVTNDINDLVTEIVSKYFVNVTYNSETRSIRLYVGKEEENDG